MNVDHGEDEENKRMHAHKSLAVAQVVKLMAALFGPKEERDLKGFFGNALKQAFFKHQPTQIPQTRRYFKAIKNGV